VRWQFLYRVVFPARRFIYFPHQAGGDVRHRSGRSGAAEGGAAPRASSSDHRTVAVVASSLVRRLVHFFPATARSARGGDAAGQASIFIEVPEMLVNLVGAPGERVQYSSQDRDRGQGREAGRGDKAAAPDVTIGAQLRRDLKIGSAGMSFASACFSSLTSITIWP